MKCFEKFKTRFQNIGGEAVGLSQKGGIQAMGLKISVRVPATSANCGPGFDSIGLACTLYDDLELELISEKRLEITNIGERTESIPTDETNLVWQAVREVLSRLGREDAYPGAVIRMKNDIPISRGLGSSSAAIVAGIKAANVLMGNPFNRSEMLQIATSMEGHPDNVAPAIFGGFTVSLVRGEKAESFSFVPRIPLKLAIAVPSFPLATSEARAALPERVPLKDAIFNLSRASMLVAAMMKGNEYFMRGVFDDALHQPYRAKLIPGFYEVISAAKEAGAIGAALSGAGPSIIAYTLKNATGVADAMCEAFSLHGVGARPMILGIEQRGVRILKVGF